MKPFAHNHEKLPVPSSVSHKGKQLGAHLARRGAMQVQNLTSSEGMVAQRLELALTHSVHTDTEEFAALS